jgi:UDP-N-acetylmuramate--alanine ligase
LITRGSRVHFVGVGGIGMSGLATVLASQGVHVSGSDLAENHETKVLRSLGASIRRGHGAENIRTDLDRVIVSSAIPVDHEEVAEARRQRIPVIPRLHAMAELFQQRSSIGVAGTHGKTTTSAMIATILEMAEWKPSFLIGADCPALGGNARWDQGAWMVAEVDESDGLLVDVRSDLAVLTNIGKDHLQTYGGIEEIAHAFMCYLRNARSHVLCVDDPRVAALARAFPQARTVGIDAHADLEARQIMYDRWTTRFDLYERGVPVMRRVLLPAPGKHNVRNALCALAASHAAGIPLDVAASALAAFRLPHRRFELLEENGVTVVDDYAHLPEEIEATLDAIRSGWPGRRIISVFQPHRYTRTQRMGEEFGAAFTSADIVLVTPIYSACEREIPGISSRSVTDAIRRQTACLVECMDGMEQTVRHLESILQPGDFIISFGAGDVWRITDRLAQILIDGGFLHRPYAHARISVQ